MPSAYHICPLCVFYFRESPKLHSAKTEGESTVTYRQLKPRALIEPQESKLSDRPLAIIARQSTTAQVKEHEESLKLQVEDARQRFISQGWSEDIITIRIAGNGKKGVSGRLRIDQRTELQETMADIKAGTCKAVGAY